jgi:hypothetical protein
VAGRYLPQQHLIGPVLFPVYLLVVKLAFWFYLLPWLGVWVGLVAFSASYRATHPGVAMVGTLATWLQLASYLFGGITIGFAVLERVQTRLKTIDRWDPRHLPAVRDPLVISRFTSISEIVWGGLFLLWWVGVLQFPTSWDDRGHSVLLTWTASFQRFYWPVALLYMVTIPLAVVNLVRPRWTMRRALWRLAGNVGGTILALALSAAGPWVDVHVAGAPERAHDVFLRFANLSLFWLFIGIAVVTALVACFEDGRRIYRMASTAGTGPTASPTPC